MRIRLANACDGKKATGILAEAYYSSASDAARVVRPAIRQKRCIIAEIDGQCAGVLAYARDYSHYANYVMDLAVSPPFRRHGAALALLKDFVARSRKEQPQKQRLALSSTKAKNKASIRLHQKAGFKKIGMLKGLHFGEDEIFFAHRL
ncbi:GNAT family N-acetyltransferase [Candidatus Micrarchaeota archaeon]|nr:GNAT family N-acetyltransferase [Candidatus Micrarchaeota archaeon]